VKGYMSGKGYPHDCPHHDLPIAPVGEFIAERCSIGSHRRVQTRELFLEYIEWAKEGNRGWPGHGHSKEFVAELRKLGWDVKQKTYFGINPRTGKHMYRSGIVGLDLS